MVRIVNREIPSNKNILIALTYIYGIGRTQAQKIVEKCHLNPYLKTKNLTEEQVKNVSQTVESYVVEEKLREEKEKIINEQISLGSYRGRRRSSKPNPLPVNGQRTRHNAQTAKKGGVATRKKKAVAGKKKAPSPK